MLIDEFYETTISMGWSIGEARRVIQAVVKALSKPATTRNLEIVFPSYTIKIDRETEAVEIVRYWTPSDSIKPR